MNWEMVRALAGAILLVLLPTVSRAVPPAPEFLADLPLQPASSHLPPGYEGALDHLRPLYPIRQPPLADPVGLAVNATGTRVYVIEKGLHRLSRIDVAPASATYGAITPITGALTDPQMAVALNAAETYAFVVENAPGTLKRVTLSSGQVTTVTAGLAYPLDLVLSPDETTAYVTQFDGALVAVNLGSGAVTTVTTGLEYPGGIALSADGKTAYVAEYREGPLRQVNLTTGAVSDLGTGDLRPSYDVAVDTAAGYAYLGDKKFHLWRVSLATGDTEMLIPNTYERTEALALSPDGATLYAGQRGAGRLLAIDLATRRARPWVSRHGTPHCVGGLHTVGSVFPPVVWTVPPRPLEVGGLHTVGSVFPLLQGPSGMALNRAGTRLYVLEGSSGELSVQACPEPGEGTWIRPRPRSVPSRRLPPAWCRPALPSFRPPSTWPSIRRRPGRWCRTTTTCAGWTCFPAR